MLRIILLLILVVASAAAIFAGTRGGAPSQDRPSKAAELPPTPQQRRAVQRMRLKSLLSAVGVSVEENSQPVAGQAFRELRIRWEDEAVAPSGTEAAQAPSLKSLTVLERRLRQDAPSRPRSSEMSPDQILVVAVDAQARMIFWTLQTDPRILRSEGPGPDGQLTGQVLYRQSAEFLVAVPDDPSVVELRIYKPVAASSQELALRPVGTINLRNGEER